MIVIMMIIMMMVMMVVAMVMMNRDKNSQGQHQVGQ